MSQLPGIEETGDQNLMVPMNYIDAPYLHPRTWKQHSRVPAKFIMLFYKADVFVRNLEEKTKHSKKHGLKQDRLTYVTFKESARESKVGRAKTQAD